MVFKVDKKKAQAALAQEEAETAARGQWTNRIYWKPKEGKNLIRVMPPWTDQPPNDFQFWRKVFVHWNVGPNDDQKYHVTCPKRTPGGQGPCPICDEWERLRKSADPVDKEAAKEIAPKKRFFANIIDLDDPTWTHEDVAKIKAENDIDEDNLPKVGAPKVQIFSYGKKISEGLLDYCAADDDDDFTDLETGYNVVLTRTGSGRDTEYRVRTEKKPSKAPVKGEPPIHNLDELMPFRSEEEMQAILEGVDPNEVRQQQELMASAEDDDDAPQQLPPRSRKQEPEEEEETEEETAEETEETEEEVEDEAEEVEEADEDEEGDEDDQGDEDDSEASEEEDQESAPDWVDDDGSFKVPDAYSEVSCFGAERDLEDEVCTTQCEAFGECGQAILWRMDNEGFKATDQMIGDIKPKPKKAPVAKAAVKKPAKAPVAKKAAAPKNGSNGKSKPAPKKKVEANTESIEDLEAQMMAALDQ